MQFINVKNSPIKTGQNESDYRRKNMQIELEIMYFIVLYTDTIQYRLFRPFMQ